MRTLTVVLSISSILANSLDTHSCDNLQAAYQRYDDNQKSCCEGNEMTIGGLPANAADIECYLKVTDLTTNNLNGLLEIAQNIIDDTEEEVTAMIKGDTDYTLGNKTNGYDYLSFSKQSTSLVDFHATTDGYPDWRPINEEDSNTYYTLYHYYFTDPWSEMNLDPNVTMNNHNQSSLLPDGVTTLHDANKVIAALPDVAYTGTLSENKQILFGQWGYNWLDGPKVSAIVRVRKDDFVYTLVRGVLRPDGC